MPIYQVKDHVSGKELELEGDSPPTEQELDEVFAAVSGKPKQQKSALQTYAVDPFNEAVSAVNRGVIDTVDLLASPVEYAIGAAKEGTLLPQGDYSIRGALKETPLSVEGGYMEPGVASNVIRTAGEVVGPSVAGGQVLRTAAQQLPALAEKTEGVLHGALRQIGKSTAGQDALYGGISGAGYAGGGDLGEAVGGDTGRQIGQFVGALAAPLGAASLKRAPKLPIQQQTGEISPQALSKIDEIYKSGGNASEVNAKIAEELTATGVLTPEQAQRFNLFQSRGVTPVRANVTQSTDDFRQLQDATKRSGAVAERVAEQDAQLFKIGRDGIENIGPTTQNAVETNSNLFKAIDNKVSELDNVVFEAYTKARDVAKGQPRITLDNLSKAISDSRGSENISGGVISAMRGVLRNKGAIRSGSDIDIDKRGARLTAEDTRKLTVTEAEEIRQNMNRFYESATPEGRRIIRELKNALDDDVAEAVGEDIFKDARHAKINMQGVIERGRRNKFDKTKGSFLEDVIDNKIPEEKIIQRLETGRDDDFIAFKRFLMNDSGPDGIQAFNNFKAQVLRNALDKAVTQGKGEGGQAIFSGPGFRNALQGLKQTKKYNELFNKDERQLIDDIIEISRLRIPNRSVAQGSGPSGFAVEAAKNEIKREIFKQIPIIGERAQAIADAIRASGAAGRQLDPLKETSKAIQGGRVFDQGIAPALSTAIQEAKQTGSSPPSNY